MKATAASVLCLVAMLFVILLTAGRNDTVLLVGVLATALASVSFALLAVINELTSRRRSEHRELIVLFGFVIVTIFVFVTFAIVMAFSNSFE